MNIAPHDPVRALELEDFRKLARALESKGESTVSTEEYSVSFKPDSNELVFLLNFPGSREEITIDLSAKDLGAGNSSYGQLSRTILPEPVSAFALVSFGEAQEIPATSGYEVKNLSQVNSIAFRALARKAEIV